MTATAVLIANASAASVLIDFGNDGTNSPAAGYVSAAMASGNSTNNTTGNVPLTGTTWSVNVIETGNGNGGNAGDGANYTGTYPAAVSGFSSDALQNGIFANGSASQLTVTFSGLSNTESYDLLFYGSRGNNGPNTSTWSITTGSGGANQSSDILNNSTDVIDWNGITADGGEIAFTISGGSNISLNFGQIVSSPIPEPSSTALLGLGGIALILRRRK